MPEDYGHGTGHVQRGTECEGPQGISPRWTNKEVKAGMVISNEPGYYEDGKYGIRIENLMEVQYVKQKIILRTRRRRCAKEYRKEVFEVQKLTMIPIEKSGGPEYDDTELD
jgi:Xaa-Pro aminopeptidase